MSQTELVSTRELTSNIVRYFEELPDPRSSENRLHLLGDVIVIAICGILANADGPTAIAKWAKLNETELKKHLVLPNGMLVTKCCHGLDLKYDFVEAVEIGFLSLFQRPRLARQC